MPDLASRLLASFQTVFPDLPEPELRAASQSTVPAWDSVAAITLANVIEEDFQLEIDFDDLADLDSFSGILDYLKTRVDSSAA